MNGKIKKYIQTYKMFPIPLKTTILYVFFNVLQKGISFFVVPIYTRIVSTEQYGIYSTFFSWEAVICIFATLNMWNYQFTNGMMKYEDKREKFVSALVGLSCVVSCVVFGIIFLFKDIFIRYSDISTMLLCVMFVTLFLRPAYEYWCSEQRFKYSISKYIITAIVIAMTSPIVSVILVYLYKFMRWENTGTALILGKSLVVCIVYFVVLVRTIKRNKKIYDKEIWRYALNYSVPLVPHFLSTVILGQCDRIMISKMCGYSEAAIYSVAYSVGAIMVIFNAAINDSIIPWVYRRLKSKEYNNISLINTVSITSIVVINLLVSLCAPEIISFMAPEEYQIAMYIIPPVAISNVFLFLYNLYANIEYYYEETKMVACASVFSAVANIILNFYFIKKFGFLAAGYTTIACYMLYAFCHFLFSKHVMKINKVENKIFSHKILWGIAGIGVILSNVSMLLYEYFAIRFLIILIAFTLVFVNIKKIKNILL